MRLNENLKVEIDFLFDRRTHSVFLADGDHQATDSSEEIHRTRSEFVTHPTASSSATALNNNETGAKVSFAELLFIETFRINEVFFLDCQSLDRFAHSIIRLRYSSRRVIDQ